MKSFFLQLNFTYDYARLENSMREGSDLVNEAVILFGILIVVINIAIFYFVLKAAIRNGIIESHQYLHGGSITEEKYIKGDKISKVTCKNCKNEFDMDYPACPVCKQVNS